MLEALQGGRVPQDGCRTCGVARECGGCSQVNVDYSLQLAAKDERVSELFAEGFTEVDIRPILGMDDPYRYRNKVTSPFVAARGRSDSRAGNRMEAGVHGRGGRAGRDRKRERAGAGSRDILTGMYAAGSHRVIASDDCLVENEQARRVVKAVRSIMLRHGIEPYDEDRGTGFMRHAVVRVGHESGEVLVTLVTNSDEFPSSKSFCRQLVKACPFVTTVVQNVNTRRTNVILGESERRLYGPGFILDTLCGLSFRISSRSFYQVNAVQTAVLYEQAIKLAQLTGAESAIDAYCGTGTIGLVAASRGAAEVVGVDSVESAIRDARENARHNGVENARFVTADAGSFMRETAAAGRHVDVVFLDPPRAGSTEEFLDALAQLAPSRVVYISCNPETQVRDMRHLAQRGYSPRIVQPVDMFPHTDHVETVVLMSRENSR